jgi:hypothetical protein
MRAARATPDRLGGVDRRSRDRLEATLGRVDQTTAINSYIAAMNS